MLVLRFFTVMFKLFGRVLSQKFEQISAEAAENLIDGVCLFTVTGSIVYNREHETVTTLRTLNFQCTFYWMRIIGDSRTTGETRLASINC